MEKSAILLDLDYTIFQTNTIDQKVVAPFFENLLASLKPIFTSEIIEKIVHDLWKDSWDVVVDRYTIPKEIFMKSIEILENTPLELKISTYTDYQFVKNYPIDKFLVTTGVTSLQKAKIKALNIENDFKEIIINDRLVESRTKLDIFRTLIKQYNLIPEKTYVIGDNPYSEIEAGNSLHLKTIQIVRDHVVKGNNANFYINSFEELKNILHGTITQPL